MELDTWVDATPVRVLPNASYRTCGSRRGGGKGGQHAGGLQQVSSKHLRFTQGWGEGWAASGGAAAGEQRALGGSCRPELQASGMQRAWRPTATGARAAQGHTGAQVCRCTGVQVYRCAGVHRATQAAHAGSQVLEQAAGAMASACLGRRAALHLPNKTGGGQQC